MVEFGSDLARRHGIANLEYKLGDIEEVPLLSASVHLALLSQALHHAEHPPRALAEAFRILKPGGLILVLDLKEHHFEKARELYVTEDLPVTAKALYADRWLGFTENNLYQWLRKAGFAQVEVAVVAREDKEPFFETLLASGVKK